MEDFLCMKIYLQKKMLTSFFHLMCFPAPTAWGRLLTARSAIAAWGSATSQSSENSWSCPQQNSPLYFLQRCSLPSLIPRIDSFQLSGFYWPDIWRVTKASCNSRNNVNNENKHMFSVFSVFHSSIHTHTHTHTLFLAVPFFLHACQCWKRFLLNKWIISMTAQLQFSMLLWF